MSGHRRGEWRGKGLVVDPRDGRQRTVWLDVIAQEPDRLRLDVTATLGTYVGTFVSSDGRFTWLSALEKRFVTGAADSAAARALLRLPIGPGDIIALLFDSPLGKSWSCSETSASGARRCENAGDQATVEISRDGEARKLLIRPFEQALATQLRLEPSQMNGQSNGQSKDEPFVLVRPRGFADVSVSP